VTTRLHPKSRWQALNNTITYLSAIAVLTVLPAWWVGCAVSEAQSNDVPEDQKIEDADITRAIDADFWADEIIDANDMDVITKEGVVTLEGTTDSILEKERALRITEATRGVRAIVNKLEVKPLVQRNDMELEGAVRRALANDPATDSYEVTVQVTSGVVTIEGDVDSWQERELCTTVAKSVSGVIKVRNVAKVEHDADRPDAEIKPEIEARLANDVLVDDYLINVQVEDQKVTLTGSVGSLAEKYRAQGDAWVGGVESVDVSGLEIRWWAEDSMRRKSLYQSRPDEEIRSAVKDAFVYDPRVLSFKPYVHVENGTVTLTGIVDNLEAKKAAEQDARNVMGVRRVKNHLKVRPAYPMTAEDLEDRVDQAFLLDPYLERWDIDIDAYNGAVYLSGEVHTSFEKQHAADVAEGVKGVTSVVNNIDYQHRWEWKPDWQIRDDVKDQLYWSIHVDEDDVTVKVDNGVVTLTGEVNSWSEYLSAEKNAFQAGAKDVRNFLAVDYDQPLASSTAQ
jgi:osmotically-inducible protein OsmY